MAGNGHFSKLANLADVPDGGTTAVDAPDGRSIALFNVAGTVYATNNQCPHMGYPLTRGVVRQGVVTCDWHARSFDLEGGGCFMPGCDDLETYPVEVRDGEVWVLLSNDVYERKDQHLRLLWEGLLTSDEWTMAKAIAQLLEGGVSEAEIIEVCVRHLGRHIATRHGPDGGFDVSQLLNGIQVAKNSVGNGEKRSFVTSAPN
jgi:nitrite reductase/ring-hydroxylating ferredoxin subunit